ncbi:MAG TPA: BlaI/MecI/CopY family transcriptional regulator [Saprospiraceae bacterium]|nr:BlaI/MecI/CopY family transcriptional regulator [Saprospiraceae bacterium]HMQ84493.1 BlaI/MecI/CopY family transcriptional regulator [Saprospiraceae bacterium]
MKKLTRAEEEIMQIIWEIAPCTVSDIRNYMEEKLGQPKPPHSSVSTIVRILDDKKNFLTHKAYGKIFVYEPQVSKEAYSRFSLKNLVSDYFEGSMNRLVSFLIEEKDLDAKDLERLLDQMEEDE